MLSKRLLKTVPLLLITVFCQQNAVAETYEIVNVYESEIKVKVSGLNLCYWPTDWKRCHIYSYINYDSTNKEGPYKFTADANEETYLVPYKGNKGENSYFTETQVCNNMYGPYKRFSFEATLLGAPYNVKAIKYQTGQLVVSWESTTEYSDDAVSYEIRLASTNTLLKKVEGDKRKVVIANPQIESEDDINIIVQTVLLGSDRVSEDVEAPVSSVDPESAFIVELESIGGYEKDYVEIPNGRPIYAFLVSGFHQNRDFELFHFYNFAKCLLENGAYVHYSWWNNLLAPYMERPLHNPKSLPSTGPVPSFDGSNKAIPNEDHQFQSDARVLLSEIRKHNPNAAIILVGHSMGGDAVARLASYTEVDIALLAPIDPVGNRSCISDVCSSLENFTRKAARINDKRDFGANIKYLYHRWQNECLPPFDFLATYTFNHPDSLATDIHSNSTNVQSMIQTSWESGLEARLDNNGGLLDGHGEIVGFRGIDPSFDYWFQNRSYPLALEAKGDWPRGHDNENSQKRVEHLKNWEKDPNYIRSNRFEPTHPHLCMVSDDMCEILEKYIVLQTGPSSIQETMFTGINIYPIPVTDELYISFTDEQFNNKCNIRIHSLDGKLLYSSGLIKSEGIHAIKTSVFKEGIYVLSLEFNKRTMYSKVLIK